MTNTIELPHSDSINPIDDKVWLEYIDILREEDIFAYTNNKTVLELAANSGWHSRLIYKNNPKKLVCVEPDTYFYESLHDTFASQYENIECFWDTYNGYLQNKKEKFDVVVCCGLLYHLHSPLDCLEKIINIHQPKILIIESTDVHDEHLNLEKINRRGNAVTDNFNHIPYNFCIPTEKYKEILSKVNYKCIKEYKWSDYGVKANSKKHAVMMVFKND